MASKAIPTQGVTLSYDSGTSTFEEIGEVTDLSGPGGQANVIDVSSLGSTYAEKLMGLPDEGQISATVNLVPDDVGQVAMRDARTNKDKTSFKITLTDTAATTLTFDGYVLGFTVGVSADDKVTADITIEITGAVTWSTT